MKLNSIGGRVLAVIVLVGSASSVLGIDVPIVPADAVNESLDVSETEKENEADKDKSEKKGGVRTLSRVSDEVKNRDDIAMDDVARLKNKDMTFEGSRQVVQVREGVNVGLEVSRGHLNRIVTPYPSPTVMKVNNEVVTKIKGSVIYVATRGDSPVTMFVRNRGDEGSALSLTLLPRGIPPKEVRLKVAGFDFVKRGNKERAKKWELKNGYLKSIRKLVRNVARGEVPSGFSLRNIKASDPTLKCSQRGLKFDFSNGQVVEGSQFRLMAGVVTNVQRSRVEVLEKNCGSRNVKAVALWPSPLLKPGQQGEVFVVLNRQSDRPDPSRLRPSLINGRGQ